AEVVLQKLRALDAGGLGEPQQPAFLADESAVEVVKLLDEARDAGVVEADAPQQRDRRILQFVMADAGRRRQRGPVDDRGDTLLAQLAELLVDIGDLVEERGDIR